MILKEPYSTVSNAFYGLAGLGIAYNGILSATSNGYVYVALSAFLLMIGSGLYHATHKASHQSYDEIAMYIMLGALIGNLFGAEASEGGGWIIWMFFSFWAFSEWKHVDSFVVVPTMTIAAIIAIGIIKSWQGAGILFLLFAISALLRQIGEKFYHGTSMEEAFHSLWHLGTAYAIFLSYLISIE